jgi:hypothetical protein
MTRIHVRRIATLAVSLLAIAIPAFGPGYGA